MNSFLNLTIFAFLLTIITSVTAKNLTGRFIHITDIHPDTWYDKGTTEKNGCHRKDVTKKEKGGEAGHWGLEVSNCDSPITLVDATFTWIESHFKGQVDFVIWTGDSARHDIDNNHPRSMREIFDLNIDIAKRMSKAFGNVKIPIVPSIGNNDIYPHNIMFRGPNQVTQEFSRIWDKFIPDIHVHTFERGGYFWTEVIPREVVVFSLNTLYFYDSNKIVDGCPPSSSIEETDPGTEQLEWLEVQLKILRDLGYQVYLTGHVPPSPGNWFEGCYQRYGEIILSFQDTILGNHFGHMNEDHFFWIDAHEVLLDISGGGVQDFAEHVDRSPLTAKSHLGPQSLEEDLKKDFSDLPKQKARNLNQYSIINVAPSIIPTYYPSMRVFTYNISRGENDGNVFKQTIYDSNFPSLNLPQDPSSVKLYHDGNIQDVENWDEVEEEDLNEDEDFIQSSAQRKRKNKKKKKNKRKHGHKHDKSQKPKKPRLPQHQNSKSPSRTNRYLTPLGYTQWYTQIDRANENHGWGPLPKGVQLDDYKKSLNGTRPNPKWQIEYVTYKTAQLKESLKGSEIEEIPRPWPVSLDALAFVDPYAEKDSKVDGQDLDVDVKIDGNKDQEKMKERFMQHLTVYKMRDLTIKRYLELAYKLGHSKKLWRGFVSRMYVSSEEPDD